MTQNRPSRGRFSLALVSALFAVGAPAVAAAQASPNAGARAWLACRSCHTLKAGEPNKIGPNLAGIAGARAATRPGFTYSPALKESRLVWTDANLDSWLALPGKLVPGSRMAFAGIKDPASRAALIAYIKTEAR